MSNDEFRAAERVARRFLGEECRLRIRPLGAGLINETFLVEREAADGGAAEPDGRPRRAVLQRLNPAVFPNPAAIDTNLVRLHAALARRRPAPVRLPEPLADAAGRTLIEDPALGAWRLLEYIEGSRVLPGIERLQQAREIGRVLGAFHAFAAGLDPATFEQAVPGFHDTGACHRGLEAALASPARTPDAEIREALAQIERRRALIDVLASARDDGRLPLRVTHGDPKLDNVLFAEGGDRALCLIDLDTVQPGLVHHDIADALRSCCRRADGAGGPTAVRFDLARCRALLGGYAGATPWLLGDAEIGLLYPAIRLLPLELAMRFLADHLSGDRYFRVTAPNQNLAKAQAQLALLADIESNQDAIERIIAACFSAVRGRDGPPAQAGQRQGRRRRRLEHRRAGLVHTAALPNPAAPLAHLHELLVSLGHPRAAEVGMLRARFDSAPEAAWRELNSNRWWAGAGSLAAETMGRNPGLDPVEWQAAVRAFRESLSEIGEALRARGDANPGVESWLLAFAHWNASQV